MKRAVHYCLSLGWERIIPDNNGYRDSNGINSNVTSGSLQLTQVLFDMSKWRAPDAAGKTAGIQDVTYQTDQQTLILNHRDGLF